MQLLALPQSRATSVSLAARLENSFKCFRHYISEGKTSRQRLERPSIQLAFLQVLFRSSFASMAPLPPSLPAPRVIVYHQTHHTEEQPVSILPLLPHITHLILAAIHLNDPPGHITLNDHVGVSSNSSPDSAPTDTDSNSEKPPSHPRNQTLWAETHVLRATGIKILALLGGAAKGSFTRLDLDQDTFESYYTPLRDLIRERQLDGLDLDVEEPMTLAGIIRLIDRLRADFGPGFLITLAPVAAALMSANPEHNLSGFDYEALEVYRGKEIAWYNTQFYCGWGDASTTRGYDFIVSRGFKPEKVVMGLVSNPSNGSGFVDFGPVTEVLASLRTRFGPAFGGVMAWEYYNSLPGGSERPWEWAAAMKAAVKGGETVAVSTSVSPDQASSRLQSTPFGEQVVVGNRTVAAEKKDSFILVDVDNNTTEEALLPSSFEYFTDGSVEE